MHGLENTFIYLDGFLSKILVHYGVEYRAAPLHQCPSRELALQIPHIVDSSTSTDLRCYTISTANQRWEGKLGVRNRRGKRVLKAPLSKPAEEVINHIASFPFLALRGMRFGR